jgi:CRISPR/Cas system CSM-associated protein Csm3 (group 7 of RAMP superfamily)
MSFDNRWTIVGRLTTRAALRIGSGDITERAELKNEQTKKPIQINAVATDNEDRAYVPGSTIKGNLRSWAKASGLANVEFLFGSEDSAEATSVGGKAEFYDAMAADESPAFIHPPPYWNATRMTGVTASVTIDRRTRTASEERLFHLEFVPPGVTFEVSITGQDLTHDEVVDLLRALNGFNTGAVRLGAATGDGWGMMEWSLTDLKRVTQTEVADWIARHAPTVGYAALQSVPSEERDALIHEAAGLTIMPAARSAVALGITLNFESHFLVNDPSQTGKVEEGKAAHTPLLDTDGRIVLPASSLRGALRSQAEKILRTMHGEQAACYPDSKGARSACEAVYEVGDLGRLCPACRLFGAPGWRSPLEISDFKTENPVSEEDLTTQEFLAIDRFTGGGAEGAKFNAKSIYRPKLSGSISVNLKALERAGAGRWALGLLTVTLRDLIEGDVRLGFGAAKGYGSVRAEITATQLPAWGDCPDLFKADLLEDQWQLDVFNILSDDDLRIVMQFWVTELAEMRPLAAA